jgi:hypothetical protein
VGGAAGLAAAVARDEGRVGGVVAAMDVVATGGEGAEAPARRRMRWHRTTRR